MVGEIFISCDSTDRTKAEIVSNSFEQVGWPAFWGQRILTGESWCKNIANKLEKARCVLVLWSTHTIRSEKSERANCSGITDTGESGARR